VSEYTKKELRELRDAVFDSLLRINPEKFEDVIAILERDNYLFCGDLPSEEESRFIRALGVMEKVKETVKSVRWGEEKGLEAIEKAVKDGK